jgi:hypothetical protein
MLMKIIRCWIKLDRFQILDLQFTISDFKKCPAPSHRKERDCNYEKITAFSLMVRMNANHPSATRVR